MPTELRVEVVAEAAYEDEMARASAALMAHDMVQVDFAGRDLWMVAHDVVDKGVEAGQRFSAIVQDMDSGRVLRADGRFDELDYASLIHTDWQRPPTDDEFAWAVDAVKEHLTLGPALEAGELEPYRPMPPLANRLDVDGNVERVVAVGLRSPAGEHRVVGVLTSDGEVILEPAGVPAPSSDDSGVPRGPAAPAVPGGRQARVRVWQGDERVWDLVVVRPSASSGTNGSGVELRFVDYRGVRVLHRAHLPIVTVEFGEEGVGTGCEGTARHWAHQEAAFEAEAEGDDPVAGFRLCSTPPQTILDAEVDGGGFRGVALWLDGDELVVLSQLEAGPYRYVNEWRLGADGTIRPRLGFSAAANSCTGKPHVHHAYWRLDFDIQAPGSNVLREYNDPPIRGETRWHLMRFEAKRPRDPAHGRFWRIRHDRDGRDYSVVPGPHDGLAADSGDFAVGDVWILRFDPDELDDNQGYTTDPALARAGIDRFVSGEPVHGHDMVVWYAVHVPHPVDEAGAGGGGGGSLVGPDLVAGHWTSASYTAPELLDES